MVPDACRAGVPVWLLHSLAWFSCHTQALGKSMRGQWSQVSSHLVPKEINQRGDDTLSEILLWKISDEDKLAYFVLGQMRHQEKSSMTRNDLMPMEGTVVKFCIS